jgi:hypothetical protein
VHPFGTDSLVLYRVTIDGHLDFPNDVLASLTVEGPDRNGDFFEAQGGVESSLMASDEIAYLRNRPFSLVEDWKSNIPHLAGLPPCEIKYAETERYRNWHPLPEE